jgi:hypothetical protein
VVFNLHLHCSNRKNNIFLKGKQLNKPLNSVAEWDTQMYSNILYTGSQERNIHSYTCGWAQFVPLPNGAESQQGQLNAHTPHIRLADGPRVPMPTSPVRLDLASLSFSRSLPILQADSRRQARAGDQKAGATPRACDREASAKGAAAAQQGRQADQEIPTVARRAESTHRKFAIPDFLHDWYFPRSIHESMSFLSVTYL